MRQRYTAIGLGVGLTVLVLAAPVQAHELTERKAKNALKPIAAELVNTVAPAIAKKLPGTTVGSPRVGGCEIKKSHRAECVITFSVQGAVTGETECGVEAGVRFRSARSRKLEFAVGRALICVFPVPLQ